MIEVILLGVALAMDSLAMSIVNGIKYSNYSKKNMFLTSLSFGIFQGVMPLLGYLVLTPFLSYIERFDHWLILIVLCYIGIGMIKDSFESEEVVADKNSKFTFKILMAESFATAIDALSVGVALPNLALNPYLSALIICICTFIVCLIGHMLGKKIALILKNKALFLGGLVLVLIGVKEFLTHIGIL